MSDLAAERSSPRLSPARSFLVGAYALVITVYLGIIVADIAQTRTVEVQADRGDVLLLVWAGVFVVGLGALAAAWGQPRVRNILIASLTLVAGEVMIPVLVAPFIRDPGSAATLSIGPWIRLAISGAAFACAVLAARRTLRV